MSVSAKVPIYFSKSKGVDKLLRFLQYLAKGADASGLTKRFSPMAAQLSLARKVLRFGNPLALILRLLRRFQKEELSLMKCLASVSELMLVTYLLTDHLLFFHKIGLYQFKRIKLIESVNDWSSLIDSSVGLLVSGSELAEDTQSFANWLAFIVNLVDMPLSLAFLSEKISPLTVCNSGIVTSVIGAMQLWITL